MSLHVCNKDAKSYIIKLNMNELLWSVTVQREFNDNNEFNGQGCYTADSYNTLVS